MGLLDRISLYAVHDAIMTAGLMNQRNVLLAGVPRGIVAGLPKADTPAAQVLSDLYELSDIGVVADGAYPLIIWLQNAAQLAGPRVESLVFREVAERYTAITSLLFQQRSAYSSSRLSMIISGILAELPISTLQSQSLNPDRTLIDLYRCVEHLINKFENICQILADLLAEAFNGSVRNRLSIQTLDRLDVASTNMKLVRISQEMRDIADSLGELVATESLAYRKLRPVAELCIGISLREDDLVVLLGNPRTLPSLREEDAFISSFILSRELSPAIFDSSESAWGSPSPGEVKDLERMVLQMENYRSALRSAIARLADT